MALIEADDWLKLPEELLLQALNRLSLPDLLRSAAVCTTWCSSTHQLRRHPLQCQAPWLMVAKEDVESRRFDVKFYSLTERRFYTFSLPYHPPLSPGIRISLSPQYRPPFNRNVFHGSSHGWMIIADDRSDLYLFNPITGTQVRRLPPAASLDFIEPIYDEQGELSQYHNHGGGLVQQDPQSLRRFCYRKIALSSISSCPSDGDYTIMVAFNSDKLAFAKAGDYKWTTTSSDYRFYIDIVFHNGDFYLLTRSRSVEVWDLNGNQKGFIDLLPQNSQQPYYAETEFLVPSPLGEYLFLVKSVDIRCPSEEFKSKNGFKRFEIYKIDLVTKKVSDHNKLGDYAFFVASNHSMCAPCTDFPELKPRCVYYTINGSYAAAIGIYDIETGSSEYHELIDDDDDEYSTWQPLTWIVPSLQ